MDNEAESGESFRLRFETKLKNSQLIEARERLGLGAAEAAEKIGVSYQTLLRYEAMKAYPKLPMQKKICGFYRRHGIFLYAPDVFPDALKPVRLNGKYIVEKEIPVEKLLPLSRVEKRLLLPSHVEQIVEDENIQMSKDIVAKLLSELPEYLRRVLELRWGLEGTEFEGQTPNYGAVGKVLGITGSGAQSREKRALKILRTKYPWLRATEKIPREI